MTDSRALRWFGWAATAGAAATFTIHAWLAIRSGYDLSPTSGVWLGLARDVADGVLYRPILSSAGYGGTRYVPALFTAIGGLMRAGMAPLAAAFLVQIAAIAALAAAVYAIARRYELRAWQAATLAALAISPYFVHETLFEVRADVLAVAFALWGLHAMLPATGPRAHAPRPASAAVWFTLALATKVTAVAGPFGAIAALWMRGERRAAGRLTLFLVVGVLAAFGVTDLVSHGRVLESFRAVAFVGVGAAETFRGLLVLGPHALATGSAILNVVFCATAAAIVIDIRRAWRDPLVLFALGSIVTTSFVLNSPGTVVQNQIIELYVASVLCLGLSVRRKGGIEPIAFLLIASLIVVSIRHVAKDIIASSMTTAAFTLPAEREQLIRAVDGFRAPVLSESAVYPVLAGQSAYLIDAYAFRVIVNATPAVAEDIRSKLDTRFFRYIILEHDPESPAGAGAYLGLHFGQDVIARMLEDYRLDQVVGSHRVYVPK